MADIFSESSLDISNLKTIVRDTDENLLLSTAISSLNFDGAIPKKAKLKYVSEILAGDTIFAGDPFVSSTQFFITSVEKATVDDENYYFIYYLSKENIRTPFTYDYTYSDELNGVTRYGYGEGSDFYVLSDDIENISIGNNGWSITNNGNAVFSNVFVRGKVEATSGIFDGIITAGKDKSGLPLVRIGKNLFNGSEFAPRGVADSEITKNIEASGLYINPYTYLLSYTKDSYLYVNRIVAENYTDLSTNNYYATLTYNTDFFVPGPMFLNGSSIFLNGFDDNSINGLKIIYDLNTTNKTFKIKLSAPTTTLSVSAYAENSAFEDKLLITNIESGNNITSSQQSKIKLYFDNTSLFNVDDYISLTLFSNEPYQTLLSDKTFKIIEKTSTYISIVTPRITASDVNIDFVENENAFYLHSSHSKFGVGGSGNYLSYSSENNELFVSGTITASSGDIGGWQINTNGIYANAPVYDWKNGEVFDGYTGINSSGYVLYAGATDTDGTDAKIYITSDGQIYGDKKAYWAGISSWDGTSGNPSFLEHELMFLESTGTINLISEQIQSSGRERNFSFISSDYYCNDLEFGYGDPIYQGTVSIFQKDADTWSIGPNVSVSDKLKFFDTDQNGAEILKYTLDKNGFNTFDISGTNIGSLSIIDKVVVAKATLAYGVSGSGTANTITNAFNDMFVPLDPQSVYYFEAYIPITKTASASSGNWLLSFLYQNIDTGANISPQSFYTAINTWYAGGVDTTTTTYLVNSNISIGTATTAATTRYTRIIGYLITNLTTQGKFSIGFGQSRNANDGGVCETKENAYISVYKTNVDDLGSPVEVFAGNWVF